MTRPIVHILLCHSPDLPGAKTPSGWTERQLAADVNGCMFARLMGHGVQAQLHQQDLLTRRIQALKRAWPQSPHQVAIEVHFDACKDRRRGGYSTLAYADSPHSMRLAKLVHRAIAEVRPDAPDRDVCACRGDLRYVGTPQEYPLRRLALLQDVPQWSVIPEPAFLSNADDEKWLLKFESRRSLGYAIAAGIMDFLDTLTVEVPNER